MNNNQNSSEYKANYNTAKNKATEILSENFVLTPPVDPFELAGNYGLKFSVAIFEDDTISGYLNLSEKRIYLNANDPLPRQVFTAAHEFGHFVLGHKISGGVDVLYRKAIGDHQNDQKEKEANAFAAELLVPEEFIVKQKKLLNHLSLDQQIAKLSQIFKVSKQVISYRLKLLNLNDN